MRKKELEFQLHWLEQNHPKTFEKLVLLSRSGQFPGLSVEDIQALFQAGVIKNFDFESSLAFVKNKALDVLRNSLYENRKHLADALARLATENIKLFRILEESIERHEELDFSNGRKLQFYHLSFYFNGGFYPLFLLFQMTDQIEQMKPRTGRDDPGKQ